MAQDINADMAVMKQDMADVKVSIEKVAEALTKLAILEDRQSAQMVIMDRMIARLEAMEKRQHETDLALATKLVDPSRVTNIETKITAFEASVKTAGMAGRFFWAVCGGGLATVATLVIKHLS